jgi:hypothetical protein
MQLYEVYWRVLKICFFIKKNWGPSCSSKCKKSLNRYQRDMSIIRKSKDRQQNGQKKKDKQRSTKHTYKTKDRVTRTPLKTWGELRCSGRVSSSCSTSGTRLQTIKYVVEKGYVATFHQHLHIEYISLSRFQSLRFLTWFPLYMVAAKRETTESRVPSG